MLKAVVVEDEQNLLNLLVYFLNNHAQYDVVGAFDDPEAALQAIPQLAPDLIFLDIEMPKMNGIELATHIKDAPYQLIFTTAYEQYALQALKLEASEYLLKPISPENIDSITPKILKKDQMLKNYISSSTTTNDYFIQCFGSFTVTTANEQTIKWPTRKVEELFAYFLIHSGCVINKWRLAEELWPGKSINNIYNSVYLLNKTLKKYDFPLSIVNMNEGYKLEIGASVKIDILQFNQLDMSDVSAKELLDLINMMSQRGALLQDKDYPWITLYREQYAVKHQKILYDLLQYYETKDSIVYEGLLRDYQILYEE